MKLLLFPVDEAEAKARDVKPNPGWSHGLPASHRELGARLKIQMNCISLHLAQSPRKPET